ncbi:MAG: hypothetical protein KJO08_01770, partial [Gammaproteobacteria bacterium]|nr:hypothetical protein [Gammaproteobacteria bacterium]NNJ85099.1 hypothetical protein [Gammaproteobacteria bacterium]
PTGIDIATRSGDLRLLTVQRPGAKPVSVADFLNGYRDPGVIGIPGLSGCR